MDNYILWLRNIYHNGLAQATVTVEHRYKMLFTPFHGLTTYMYKTSSMVPYITYLFQGLINGKENVLASF